MAERVIGVDVGGTKVSVAALEDGVLSEPALGPTERASADALVDQLVAAVRAAGPAVAVGVGVPSVVDTETGTARASVNVPLQGVPLRALLSERLALPVFVDNDASVAALGEAYDDALRPIASVLAMLTIGTGVGGGIVIDGQLFRGRTGAAAEVGHMIVAAELAAGAPAAPERFPAEDALEHYASGRSLDALGRERGFADGPAVVAAARAGDAAASDCLRIVGERVGVGVANLVNLLDPDLVVIGGGVSQAGALLLEPARAAAQRFILPGVGTQTRIELARYGPRAGVRGAALLALLELRRAATGTPR